MGPRDAIKRKVNLRRKVVDPEHRIKALLLRSQLDSQASDVDPVVDQVLRTLNGDVRVTEDVAEAFHLWLDDFKRGRLSAWLFAGADDRVVEESLGVRQPIVALYRRFFFDTSVFVDRLDRERFADQAKQRVQEHDDIWYHQLLFEAFRNGLNVLVSVYSETFSPDAAVTRVARDLFMEYLIGDGPVGEDAVSSRRDLTRLLLAATKAMPPAPENNTTAREQAAMRLREDVEAERIELAMNTNNNIQIIH